MTRQIFIYLFLLLTTISFGQKDKSHKTNDAVTLELKVILKDDISKVKLPPNCGIFEVNSLTLTYKVIKVIRGDYQAKTILINHRCPRQLVDKKLILNDTTYTYKLRQKITQTDRINKPDETEYEVIG